MSKRFNMYIVYIKYVQLFAYQSNINKTVPKKRTVPRERGGGLHSSPPLWAVSINMQLAPTPLHPASLHGGRGSVGRQNCAKYVLINSEPYWQLCGFLQPFAAWKTFSD